MYNANDSASDTTADMQRELEKLGLDNSILKASSPESPTASTTRFSMSPTASTSRFPKILTLDISGHKFKVSRDILEAGSGLFALQLSDQFTWEPQADGSYFMDADPEIFEYLIRFMRRPESYPLFYDQTKGFDYDLYRRLEVEAEYFQVNLLTEWIKSEKYLQAVKTVTTSVTSHIAGSASALSIGRESLPQNRSQQYHFIPQVNKTYICPRGISCHMGERDRCGMACIKARGGLPAEYDEHFSTQIIVFDKQITFDRAICQVE
ncbi:hypothetical protein CFE70_005384 [Pyrenophora teres f. teres 0-1]|uniref:BTB domain-containing protein n=1 Tax=Pyrenophora teres f. teres (strain 0-1) TaxID=861557 RepID=E3RGR7_PYRTT|nr:hypothetical protein PTT_07018 [Pyrenophora teres f. teres 0-1]